MIDIQRMQKTAEEYEVFLSSQLLDQLDHYAEMLVDWNSRINLTAITEPEQIEAKHFLDSLLLANQPEIQGTLVDVGSGAGFPGMVTKLYKPDLQVTLMEPTGKRCRFLEAVAEELNVSIDVVKERAEEAARKKWRESFTVATARAVASLPALCEYCLPLVKVGGTFIAMKGEAAEEIEQAKGAIEKLGGVFKEERLFSLPDGSSRSLVVIQKTEETPKVYPRNGGRIAKTPLK